MSTESAAPLIQPGDFPAASKCTYLNSASVSLMFKGAEVAARAWQADIAESGTLNFDEVAEDRVFDDLRSAFAELIGARADDIAVASSATELLASLAWAVAPAKGQNIVVVDVTFPSTAYPWWRVAETTGAEMRWVRGRDAYASDADILDAIDDRTAVVCLSHVEYGSGQRYDLARIGSSARAHGALLVVDATQSLGAIPFDVETEPVDALVTGSYKWLCGPFGVGLLYVAPQHQNNLKPGLVGWRSHKDIYDLRADRVEFAPGARRFEFSTMAYGCALGLTESIRYLLRVGIDRVFTHNLQLSNQLREHLQRLDAQVLSPSAPQARTSIVSCRFPGRDSPSLVRRLGQSGIVASPRRDFIRFSLHLYNTTENVEQVADVLMALLRKQDD